MKQKYLKHRCGHFHPFIQYFDIYSKLSLFGFPPVSDGVIQLLEALGGRLMTSLKEVLVEKNQLTLGKELGKG